MCLIFCFKKKPLKKNLSCLSDMAAHKFAAGKNGLLWRIILLAYYYDEHLIENVGPESKSSLGEGAIKRKLKMEGSGSYVMDHRFKKSVFKTFPFSYSCFACRLERSKYILLKNNRAFKVQDKYLKSARGIFSLVYIFY